MKKYISLTKQHDEVDCGASCLTMVLEHFGRKLTLAHVRGLVKVDQEGTNIYGLIDGAGKEGLHAEAMEGSGDELFASIASGEVSLPVIARIVNQNHFEHYVVLTAVRGDQVYYCDPGEGKCHLSRGAFCSCFLGQIVTFTKTDAFVAENKRKGCFSKYVSLITRQKGLVALVGLLSLFVTGVGLLSSALFQVLIDDVVTGIDGSADAHGGLELLAVFILMLGVLYLVRYLFQLLRGKLLMFMTKRMNLSLMLGYSDHVVDLPMSFFGTNKTGDVISRFSDATKIQEALSGATLTIMIDVVMMLVCGVMLYRYSASLFAIAAGILILYAAVTMLYTKPLDRANRMAMAENGALSAYIKETVDGIQTVKTLGAEKTVKARTKQLFSKVQEFGIKTAMLGVGKESLIEMITSVGVLVLIWIGTVSITDGSMTLGVFMGFYTLLSFFLTPIQNIIDLQPTLQAAVAAADRLRDVMDVAPEQDEEGVGSYTSGDIRLDNVSFRYGNRNLVLNHASMVVPQGSHVALVGASGCGKTTVTKLLMRFYQPESGTITFGGTPVEKIPLAELRRRVAYVSQETFLFSGSLRENLTMGNDQVSDEELVRVLDACGCSFIKDLPFGLDTAVEENGTNLSGGQKQRLAIARALLRKPSVLLLDEATSNLDAVSERQIFRVLRELSPDTTVIMTAHRLNAASQCDKIFVIDHGKVAGEGSHDFLLKNNDAYAELWRSYMG